MAEVVDTQTGSRTTREIFEECRKYSVEERRRICEEFISDVETLADRIQDLFSLNPGVFMMYGVSVELKVTLFNDDAYAMKLGNPDFHNAVMKMNKRLEEGSDDERA